MTKTISLLISDVDGTLITPRKELTPRTITAVHALAERGVAFAVTSGRPPRGMEMLVRPLALRTPLAGFNGGIFAEPDMRVREAHTLPPAIARVALDTLLRLAVDVWVYTGQAWQVRDATAPHVAQETSTIQLPPIIVRDFATIPDGIAKIVGVSDDADHLAHCEEVMRKTLGANASASRSQTYYLDITHSDANKAVVVDTFCRMLAVPIDRVATIGDGRNDVLMFRKSAFSIAMGNASAEVRNAAHTVTASNDNDGFAKAIEQYFLT